MIYFLLFSIIYCQNLLRNPSFEIIENDKAVNWSLGRGVEISSISHTGKNSIHWKPTNHSVFSYQMIPVEKGFQYEMCVHLKLNDVRNISGAGFIYLIESFNATSGIFEYFYSRRLFGSSDWKKHCRLTGIIEKRNSDSDQYYFGLYSMAQKDTGGDIYVDDVSLRRINFRIGINNDRDEVYDDVNVVYQINGHKDNYNLTDFKLTTIIKDNNKVYYNKETEITSFFFTKKISVKKLGLVDNNFYQVESTLINKKENITDIASYTFKKIIKINRNVTIDEYGRMHVNGELFFPFGTSLFYVQQSDLALLNKTHMNCICPAWILDKRLMDMIYTTQQGKIKVIYGINQMYKLDGRNCINLKDEEEDYKQFIDKINEFKDHPNLLGWYIDDEMNTCFNKYLRNRTNSIHQLDPNHPSFTVLCYPGESNALMNTTDVMGIDNYPIGAGIIRDIFYVNDITYKEVLKAKLYISAIQIFDWGFLQKYGGQPDYKSCPPTLQEMKSMSWQGLVAGAKGILFYSLWEFIEQDKSNVEERWKDVIKFTDEIWKYKDVILSIDKVDKIEYINNYNVSFRQWKYNKTNYIAIVNLERSKESFKINLLKDYRVKKEFGLGNYKKKGSELIFNLEPIDVVMISFVENSKSNSLIIFFVMMIIIIIIAIICLFLRKYLINKYKTDNYIDSISKLMDDYQSPGENKKIN